MKSEKSISQSYRERHENQTEKRCLKKPHSWCTIPIQKSVDLEKLPMGDWDVVFHGCLFVKLGKIIKKNIVDKRLPREIRHTGSKSEMVSP